MNPAAIIQIKRLSYTYPDGTPGLRDISTRINRLEAVALVGPNGAGKSTLLLHLNGILKGHSEILVCGKRIEDKNLHEIRKMVGMVFQDPEDQLFSLTVHDDVAFGPLNLGHNQEEVRARVNAALSEVGMSEYAGRSPHHLSIGEKKRIAIATVLALDPQILVLDEPTSSLDPAGKWSLIDLIRNLAITKVIASHDLEFIRQVCQRVIILDKGELVADGATEDILDDLPLLRQHGLARNG